MMAAVAIKGIAFGFAAAVQPGPFQAYIVTQTLNHGWRRALPAAFAPLITDGPIIALVFLVLLSIPTWIQQFLYLAGGLFLLYLATNTFREWQRFDESLPGATRSGAQTLIEAALVNMLNPGPYLFWSLVAGPILLAGWRVAPAYGLGFLIFFYAALIASLGTIVFIFGMSRQIGPKVNRAMLGVSAVALAGFGMYQLWLGSLVLLGG